MTAKQANDGEEVRCRLLQDLYLLSEAEDEPDFQHSITEYAHDLARRVIEDAVFDGIPVPATAPDGDGGLVVEWQLNRNTTRLVVPAGPDRKSYVYYKRAGEIGKVDYDVSSTALTNALHLTFGGS